MESVPTLSSVDGPDHPSWCNCRDVLDE